MHCEQANPEIKPVSCIKTRSQYRASQQSQVENQKTSNNSAAKVKDLSQESLAVVMDLPKEDNFAVDHCSNVAQARATDLVLPTTELEVAEIA
jgi:anti-sigma28 factor (negative regulator of flagellin synthesis)